MKLSAIVEDDEKMVMIPLAWLTRDERKEFIREGYEVIQIPEYKETGGFRAFKIIGKYNDGFSRIRFLSIPIWEDWKLTAKYAFNIEKSETTTGQQMFDHLDDDEKIRALKIFWYPATTEYIIKYFRDHPELLKRAKHRLTINEIYYTTGFV